MEKIAIAELTEIQWQTYFDFSQRISRRYIPWERTGNWQAFRGLAKWLKCELLVYVYRYFPTFEMIDTDCNVLNTPIQKLNESLGFVYTGEGREYRIDFDNK